MLRLMLVIWLSLLLGDLSDIGEADKERCAG